MTDRPYKLPNTNQWYFDKIREQDEKRASHLENAGCPEELKSQLCEALNNSLDNNQILIGLEHHSYRKRDIRTVIQFYIGEDLYNWFFNARTGYRAHFWTDYRHGLKFNEELVEALSLKLEEKLSDSVSVLDVGSNLETQVPKASVLASLDCLLSKLWCCTKFIDNRDTGDEIYSTSADKIIFYNQQEWAVLDAGHTWAWLDLKGAFISRENGQLYQPKDPIHRAKQLQTDGTA